jgi:hypothetical protein
MTNIFLSCMLFSIKISTKFLMMCFLTSRIQKGISLVLICIFLFQSFPLKIFAQESVQDIKKVPVYDLAVFFVDDAWFTPGEEHQENSFENTLYRYAESIRETNSYLKTLILPVSQNSSPQDIIQTIEPLYFEGIREPNAHSFLTHIVLLGDIPLPKIQKEEQEIISVVPYTQIKNPAFVLSSEENLFLPTGEEISPHIVHGIFPAFLGKNRVQDILEKSILWHTSDEIPYETGGIYGDIEEEFMRSSPLLLSQYFLSQKLSEDIAYKRFTKAFLEVLQQENVQNLEDILKESDSIAEKVLQNQNTDSPWGEPEISQEFEEIFQKLINTPLPKESPDIYNIGEIKRLTPAYYQAVSSFISFVYEMLGNTGRYEEKDIDFFAKYITKRDFESQSLLLEGNTRLEKQLTDFIEKSWQIPVTIYDAPYQECPKGSTLWNPQGKITTPLTFGTKNTDISSVYSCSWYAGSLPTEEFPFSQKVEKNNTFFPLANRQTGDAGCNAENRNTKQNCKPKEATVSVYNEEGSMETFSDHIPSYKDCETNLFLQTQNRVSCSVSILPTFKKISSQWVHNEPTPQTIAFHIEKQYIASLPVDQKRFTSFQGRDFEKKEIDFPNLFSYPANLDHFLKTEEEKIQQIFLTEEDFVNGLQKELDTILSPGFFNNPQFILKTYRMENLSKKEEFTVLWKNLPFLQKTFPSFIVSFPEKTEKRNLFRLIEIALELKNFFKKRENFPQNLFSSVFPEDMKIQLQESIAWQQMSLSEKYHSVLLQDFFSQEKIKEFFIFSLREEEDGDLFFRPSKKEKEISQMLWEQEQDNLALRIKNPISDEELKKECGINYDEGVDLLKWIPSVICWAQNLLKFSSKDTPVQKKHIPAWEYENNNTPTTEETKPLSLENAVEIDLPLSFPKTIVVDPLFYGKTNTTLEIPVKILDYNNEPYTKDIFIEVFVSEESEKYTSFRNKKIVLQKGSGKIQIPFTKEPGNIVLYLRSTKTQADGSLDHVLEPKIVEIETGFFLPVSEIKQSPALFSVLKQETKNKNAFSSFAKTLLSSGSLSVLKTGKTEETSHFQTSFAFFASGMSVGESFLLGQSETDMLYGDPFFALKNNETFEHILGKRVAPNDSFESMYFLDYNGDKVQDILLTASDTQFFLLEGREGGKPFMRGEFAFPDEEVTHIVLQDMFKNGSDDILFSTKKGRIYLLRNEKGVPLSLELLIDEGEAKEITNFFLYDITKNNYFDIVYSTSAGEILVQYGDTPKMREKKQIQYFFERTLITDDFSVQADATKNSISETVIATQETEEDTSTSISFAVNGVLQKRESIPAQGKKYYTKTENPFLFTGELLIEEPTNSVGNLFIKDTIPEFVSLKPSSLLCNEKPCNIVFSTAQEFVIEVPKTEFPLHLSYTVFVSATPHLSLSFNEEFFSVDIENEPVRFLYQTKNEWKKVSLEEEIRIEKEISSSSSFTEETLKEEAQDQLKILWGVSGKDSSSFGIDDWTKNLSSLNCQKGGCLNIPMNRAFLVPGPLSTMPSLVSSVSGMPSADPLALPAGLSSGKPVFGIQPSMCPFPAPHGVVWLPVTLPCSNVLCYDSVPIGACRPITGAPDFRMYVSPTLTGGIGMAFCYGSGINPITPFGMCSAFGVPTSSLFGGMCESFNKSLESIQNSASSVFTGGATKVFQVDGVSQKSDPKSVSSYSGLTMNIDSFTRKSFDTKSNKANTPFFKGLFSRWWDKQSAEFSKLFEPPSIQLLYPKFHAENFEKTFDTKEKKTDQKSLDFLFQDVIAEIESLPFLTVKREDMEIVVPWVDFESAGNFKGELERWEEKNKKMIEAYIESIEKLFEGKNVSTDARASFENFKQKAQQFLSSISLSIENIDKLQNLPFLLKEFDQQIQNLLGDVLSYITAISDMLFAWGERQQRIISQYKVFFQTLKNLQKMLKNLQAIFDGFDKSCRTCKADAYSQNGALFQLLGAFIPEPPVVTFPKLPDITIDLSHISTQTEIILPRITLKKEPVSLDIKLPDLFLPPIRTDLDFEVSIDADIKFPDLPSLDTFLKLPEIPSLPKLVDLPPLPFPKLPNLPPAPKLPDFLKNLGLLSWLSSIQKVLHLYCIISEGMLVYPEANLTQIIESLTFRASTPLIKTDFALLQWPNISYSSVKEIRVDAFFSVDTEVDAGFLLEDIVQKSSELSNEVFSLRSRVQSGFSSLIRDIEKEIREIESRLIRKPLETLEHKKEELKDAIQQHIPEEISFSPMKKTLLFFTSFFPKTFASSPWETIETNETETISHEEEETAGVYISKEGQSPRLLFADKNLGNILQNLLVDEEKVFALFPFGIIQKFLTQKNQQRYPHQTQIGMMSSYQKPYHSLRNISLQRRAGSIEIQFEREEEDFGYLLQKYRYIQGYKNEIPENTVLFFSEENLSEIESQIPSVIGNESVKFKKILSLPFSFDFPEPFAFLRLYRIGKDGISSSSAQYLASSFLREETKPLSVSLLPQNIPVLKESPLFAPSFDTLSSYEITHFWDPLNTGDFGETGEVLSFTPEEKLSKLLVPIRSEYASQAFIDSYLPVTVFAPRILIEKNEGGKLYGTTEPKVPLMPFAFIKKREEREILILPTNTPRFKTDAQGNFILDFEAMFPGFSFLSHSGEKILSVRSDTGAFVSHQPFLSFVAQFASKETPTHIEVFQGDTKIGKVLFQSFSKEKIRFVEKETDLYSPHNGVSVFVSHPSLKSYTVSSSQFAGETIFYEEKTPLLLLLKDGQILPLSKEISLEKEFHEDIPFFKVQKEDTILMKISIDVLRPVYASKLPFSALAETTPSYEFPFTDLDMGHPYASDILELYRRNILKGYEDRTFRPNERISRAEFVKIALGSDFCFDCSSPTEELKERYAGKKPFPDVFSRDWFFTCISMGKEEKMITGYGDGLFHPNKPISRKEAVAVLLRQVKAEIEEMPENIYRDVPYYDWAKDYVHTAVQMGLMKNQNGYTFLDEEITRGEFAFMARRIMEDKYCRIVDRYESMYDDTVLKEGVRDKEDKEDTEDRDTKDKLLGFIKTQDNEKTRYEFEDGSVLEVSPGKAVYTDSSGNKDEVLQGETKKFPFGTVEHQDNGVIKTDFGDKVHYKTPTGKDKEISREDTKTGKDDTGDGSDSDTEDGSDGNDGDDDNDTEKFPGICLELPDFLCPNTDPFSEKLPFTRTLEKESDSVQCIFIENTQELLPGDALFGIVLSTDGRRVFSKGNEHLISY